MAGSRTPSCQVITVTSCFTKDIPRSRSITVDRYLFLAIMTWQWAGGRINIKISSYQYRKSYCGDKTILRPSYLHNGISYTDNMTYFYWIRALNPTPSSTNDTKVSTRRAELIWSNISICFSTMTLLKTPFVLLHWRLIVMGDGNCI